MCLGVVVCVCGGVCPSQVCHRGTRYNVEELVRAGRGTSTTVHRQDTLLQGFMAYRTGLGRGQLLTEDSNKVELQWDIYSDIPHTVGERQGASREHSGYLHTDSTGAAQQTGCGDQAEGGHRDEDSGRLAQGTGENGADSTGAKKRGWSGGCTEGGRENEMGGESGPAGSAEFDVGRGPERDRDSEEWGELHKGSRMGGGQSVVDVVHHKDEGVGCQGGASKGKGWRHGEEMDQSAQGYGLMGFRWSGRKVDKRIEPKSVGRIGGPRVESGSSQENGGTGWQPSRGGDDLGAQVSHSEQGIPQRPVAGDGGIPDPGGTGPDPGGGVYSDDYIRCFVSRVSLPGSLAPSSCGMSLGHWLKECYDGRH